MRSTLRVASVLVLAVGWIAGPAPTEAAAPARPSPAASATPIRDSIDRAVEAVILAHFKPCENAKKQGVPCFPVSVEEEGPRYSVAESLRAYRGTASPAPGAPTIAETQAHLSGAPLSQSGGVSFDPVCTAKNLFRKMSGKNTTFYLYRTWDARGERPMLTERPLDAKAYATNTEFRYELVGRFDGACEATAAWRKTLREATAPEPLPAEDWREPAEEPPPEAASSMLTPSGETPRRQP